jgi:hypothetical protein
MNEPVAAGAFNALKKAGKEKGVTIVSIDGGCEAMKNVSSGMIAATSQQYPIKMGAMGVDAAVEYAKTGKKPSGYTNTGVTLISDKAVAGVTSKDVLGQEVSVRRVARRAHRSRVSIAREREARDHATRESDCHSGQEHPGLKCLSCIKENKSLLLSCRGFLDLGQRRHRLSFFCHITPDGCGLYFARVVASAAQ